MKQFQADLASKHECWIYEPLKTLKYGQLSPFIAKVVNDIRVDVERQVWETMLKPVYNNGTASLLAKDMGAFFSSFRDLDDIPFLTAKPSVLAK